MFFPAFPVPPPGNLENLDSRLRGNDVVGGNDRIRERRGVALLSSAAPVKRDGPAAMAAGQIARRQSGQIESSWHLFHLDLTRA
jgi:hypothetical protein